ncbi:MAG: YbhN family protein [Burkholderiales bacterium]
MKADPASRTLIQHAKKTLWLTFVAIVLAWSLWLLYSKLLAEVSSDPAAKALIATGGLWTSLTVIYDSIAHSLSQVTPRAYALAGLSTLLAYVALAWYDRIALIHLKRQREFSWTYIATCSFVTYALGHNLGASVFSGGLVRLRAYGARGLSVAEVTVLVALCSFTFAYGTVMLTGIVFLLEPQIVQNLADLIPRLNLPESLVRWIGAAMLLLCSLYVLGSWRGFRPLTIRSFHIFYPKLPIVARQLIAAPLELIAAAGIIYFSLPEAGNPGFMIVLGAFLLSFSAGLVSQTPGGIGVMEAVFLAIINTVPPSDVIAALLIWRLMYLLIPLALSIPVVVAFERGQLLRKLR